jgi:Flp pilus assembly protein TadG
VARKRPPQRGQSIVEFTLVLPVMLIMLLGIVDLARIYTTMMSVESAAREAADYGTTLGAGKWQSPSPMDTTVAEMERRACVAASDLPDYADPDNDPQTGGCTNPSFSYCVSSSVAGPCTAVDPAASCENPLRSPPCVVTVTLGYDFHLLAPLSFEFMGVRYGFPNTLTFERDSSFAMTDIDLSPAAPGP